MRVKASRIVDARGYMCPYPIMLLSLTLKNTPPGDIVEVKATDPAFEKDVASWAEETGNELLEVRREGDVIIAYVRRVK